MTSLGYVANSHGEMLKWSLEVAANIIIDRQKSVIHLVLCSDFKDVLNTCCGMLKFGRRS